MSVLNRRNLLVGLGAIATTAATGKIVGEVTERGEYKTTNFIDDPRVPALPVAPGLQGERHYLAVSHGIELRYEILQPKGEAKGTFVLLPGKGDTAEDLAKLATGYAQAGYKVFSLDPRGQGASGREVQDSSRVYVESFDKYRSDVKEFFDKVVDPQHVAGQPKVLVAHSMMAAAMYVGLAEKQVSVTAFVALAPMVVAKALDGVLPKIVLRLFKAFGAGPAYVPGGGSLAHAGTASDNDYTNDATEFAAMKKVDENPVLPTGSATNAWAVAAMDNSARIAALPDGAIKVPTIVICAGNDQTVDNLVIRKMISKFAKADLMTIDGAKHELERGGPEVLKQIFDATALLLKKTQMRAASAIRPAASKLG
jgi:lysophospholipase